jgi:hypothetical protein
MVVTVETSHVLMSPYDSVAEVIGAPKASTGTLLPFVAIER